jgi:tetratricopeptide (TPR) repeat protein
MKPNSAQHLETAAHRAKNEGNLEIAYQRMVEYLSLVDASFTFGQHTFLGEIDFHFGRLEIALGNVNKAIQQKENFVAALVLRIKIFESLGRLDLAKKDKMKIKELDEIEKAKWDDPNHYYHYK